MSGLPGERRFLSLNRELWWAGGARGYQNSAGSARPLLSSKVVPSLADVRLAQLVPNKRTTIISTVVTCNVIPTIRTHNHKIIDNLLPRCNDNLSNTWYHIQSNPIFAGCRQLWKHQLLTFHVSNMTFVQYLTLTQFHKSLKRCLLQTSKPRFFSFTLCQPSQTSSTQVDPVTISFRTRSSKNHFFCIYKPRRSPKVCVIFVRCARICTWSEPSITLQSSNKHWRVFSKWKLTKFNSKLTN